MGRMKELYVTDHIERTLVAAVKAIECGDADEVTVRLPKGTVFTDRPIRLCGDATYKDTDNVYSKKEFH